MSLFRIHTMRVALVLLIVLGTLGVLQAQVRVTRITNPDFLTGRKGPIYALPRTVLEVDLEITITESFPGPYASFASELLGLEKVITTRETVYSLDNAWIRPFLEPDPEQVFMVERDEKSAEGLYLEFLPDGMLMGALPVTEEALNGERPQPGFVPPVVAEDKLFPAYSAAEMKETVDTIVRRVSFDTLTYEEKILKRVMVRQSEKEKAMEAASLINGIGQDQYNLLVGYQETAYSKEALEFMLGSLEEQRRNYLQLFTGITRKSTYHAVYTYLPGDDLQHPLTGFNRTSGPVAADGANDVVVRVEKNGMDLLAGDEAVPATGYSGYYYRIPEKCRVSVWYDGEMLAGTHLMINQYGVVRSLPATATQVEFYPETGGIRKVVLE